ncbi:MAG: TIGR01212 family radical SAM protein [Bacteroidales bacterium]|nr:TIGR01212 family radical SAM protein [Bacteroidales bacterium]
MTAHFPWGTARRFNAYPDYMRKLFGTRVQKVAIDAGFTCPNRDGTKGWGGCTYCSNEAFNPSYCSASKSITQQVSEGIEFHRNRYRRALGYIAYFQAYTNTYKSLEELDKMYSEALAVEGVTGLIIGTRPDAVDDKKLDYLAKLAEKTYLVIEYGIESVYNKTLERVNRCHTFEETVIALEKTAARHIRTGGHFIFGLPGETREEMLKSVAVISQLPLDAVKFHQLQIFKGTVMAGEYQVHPENFSLFNDLDEYLEFMVSCIENLNPGFVVERIAGEAPPRYCEGIVWDLRNDQILVKFEKLLEKRNTWQGKKWLERNCADSQIFNTTK